MWIIYVHILQTHFASFIYTYIESEKNEHPPKSSTAPALALVLAVKTIASESKYI